MLSRAIGLLLALSFFAFAETQEDVYYRAMKAEEAGDVSKSLELFEQAAAMDGEYTDEIKEIVREYREALGYDEPENPWAFHLYGDVAFYGLLYQEFGGIEKVNEKGTGDCGDGYDGLFIACWFMNSPRVDTALAERFVDWLQNDTLDRGGCSLTDVFRLIDKWERKGRCVAYEGLRDLYRDYIKRHGDVPYFKDQGLW